MSVQAIVFDVYETLIQNRPSQWQDTFGRMVKTLGLNTDPALLWKRWKSFDVEFRKKRLNLSFPRGRTDASPPFKSYAQTWQEAFERAFSSLGLPDLSEEATHIVVDELGRHPPYPDAIEVLPRLQRDWRTAIVSNADDAYLLPSLKLLGVRFEAVVSSERARAYKPLPKPFMDALSSLKVAPAQAVYVGDQPFDDVLGAKKVGMRAIWLNRNGASYDGSAPRPDAEIQLLHELPEVLKSL